MANKSLVKARLEEAREARAQMMEEAGNGGATVARYHIPNGLESFIKAAEKAGYADQGVDPTGSVPWTLRDDAFYADNQPRMIQILAGSKHDDPVMVVYGPEPDFFKDFTLVPHVAAQIAAEKALVSKRAARTERVEANYEAIMAKAALS